MTPRQYLMAAGLAVSAALALWGDKRPADDSVDAPLPSVRAVAAPAAHAAGRSVPDSSILLVDARHLVEASGGGTAAHASPFASASWAPAAPPPLAAPVAEQAAAPAAPVVPFTVLGKALSNNTWEVFLANGNTTYVVHENSTVDDTYRIDSIQPPTLQLTYLPMNTVHHLDIGAAQ